MSWLKRVRGALGNAIAWAAGWSAVGAICGLGFAIFWPSRVGFEFIAAQAQGWAMVGFVAGGAFSTILGLAEGRRRFDELSLPRLTAWGAIGGLLLGVLVVITTGGRQLMVVNAVNMAITTLLSAACAAGSLALARGTDDQELLEAGSDAASVGLTDEERMELLGEPGS